MFATLVLGVAGLITAGLMVPVFLVPPPQGYNGLGALLLMIAAASLRWLLLAILLGWAVRRGRFDWMPGGSRGGRFALVFAAHAVMGGLSLTAMLTVIDSSMLRGLPDWLIHPMHQVAQLGCTVPAVGVIACLVAVGRTGPPAMPRLPLASTAAGVLAGLLVVGALVAQEARYQQGRAAAQVASDAARDTETNVSFTALTDADTLLRWDEFVHDAKVGPEALRRLARRPTLEPDLVAALDCDCRNPLWTSELLWLLGAIPFEPGPAFAAPAQRAIAILAANVRDSAQSVSPSERDTYVDLYLSSNLDRVRVVAARLAGSAKADLRPAVIDMRQAVVESYPRSAAARHYPGEVDRTLGEIATALAKP